MDFRIERVVWSLFESNLDSSPSNAVEAEVARVLRSGLSAFKVIQRRAGIGIDGSPRNPDDARELPAVDGLDSLNLAIEYKLYRNRKKAAGEMDRALGQCIAYAEQYGAVLFLVVYMGPPQHPIPKHWLDRAAPLYVGHQPPGVPVYFAARPRSWDDPFASQFRR